MSKITLMVCRSCITENAQQDAVFKDESTLRKTYEKKLKTGLFSKLATLRIVDCLTNCENPNSVQIENENEEMLLGLIKSESQIDEVIRLIADLRATGRKLSPSEALKKNLVFVRPHRSWNQEKQAVAADRVKL
ncbi:MAG: hypothetical protein JNK65_00605 [Deltaproteobacteria bacterium]|nr:hypothetical protein [Deltaproteobacteria bacterium]